MTFRKIALTFLVTTLSVACAFAKNEPKYEPVHPLTPEQSELVNKAIEHEKQVIKSIQTRTPLVETYIQNTRPDLKLYEVPVDDQYILSRVDFGRGFFDKPFDNRAAASQKGAKGFFKGSLAAITGLSKALGLEKFNFTYSPNGFMQMMFLDPTGFDTNHYVFGFVRREFLGTVRTAVFDVHPRVAGMGRFFGRVWIEDQDGNVVRFNGTYTAPTAEDSSKYYFHFDSWRMNVQPDVWLPVAVYVEETTRIEGIKTVGLKAQTHFWGYSLKLPTRDSENVSVKVEDATDTSTDSQDVGPLQATRAWVTQAENNVIDRLVEAGLVAPLNPGGFENKVLDQIVVNLIVPNNLAFSDQIHTRILLSDTIECTTVGNTILMSKGLIDTMPNEESFASVVAMELAHIAMGHHIDTRYAFNDRLMFPDQSTFQRIDMFHSDRDNAEAAKEAIKYLSNSMYKDKMGNAGLYYAQLVEREKSIKGLNSPKLGDSLLKEDGTAWMADLEKMAPKLNWDDMNQTAALPLGSWIKTDPWDDKEHMLNAKRYAPMNARDKMPFEVTPLFFRLTRYDAAELTPPAGGAAPAPGSSAAPGSGSTQPAADPAAGQPAGSQPTPAPDSTPATPPASNSTQPAPTASEQN
jgi:hypothetical protein